MLKKIKDLKGFIILLVKIEKGKGYCFVEEDKEKFYGIVFFNIEIGNIYKSLVFYLEVFGNKILELGKEDENIYIFLVVMIKGIGFYKFLEEFFERCIDIGIVEGFIVIFVVGLVKLGKKFYVCIYLIFI